MSGLGFSVLLALAVVAALRSGNAARRVAACCIAAVLGVFYIVVEVRKILGEWQAAGRIAARVPQVVRSLRPQVPGGALLVFSGVPRMHGRAHLYPTGFEHAIQREHGVRVRVRQLENEPDLPESPEFSTAYRFEYVGGSELLREIRSEGAARPEASRK
ncbi:MAG TPA: hypothetical protein VFL57_06420 [Bryobacteraceae bacterium]|nr:hypothetical protein [Bryobacteraceae bacterium]